jgi:hypothetical protein
MLLPAKGVDFRKAGALLAAFALFVGVVTAVNYRWTNTHRAHAPKWTDQIAQATARCNADLTLANVIVRGGPQPWWSFVIVPCNELRDEVDCSAACVWLDPPQSMGLRGDPAIAPAREG